jgi:hypothetical protein
MEAGGGRREAGEPRSVAAYVGVGCFTLVAGTAGGGMIAVFVAKIVGWVQKCPSGENGMPCDWFSYALVGWVLGGLSLPAIAILRLRASDRTARNENIK